MTKVEYGQDCIFPCECGYVEDCNVDCEVQVGMDRALDALIYGETIRSALVDARDKREAAE